MPLKRRRFKVRRRLRRRVGVRRRFRRPRGLVSSNQNTHRFKRVFSIVSGGTTTTLVTGNTGVAITWTSAADSWFLGTGAGGAAQNYGYFSMGLRFQLSNLPDIAEFTALYDQYQIAGIKIKLTPYSTVANLQTGTSATQYNNNLACILHSLIDPDDGGAFSADASGINAMRQYPTYKTRNLMSSLGKPISRFFRPRIALGAFDALTPNPATARVNSRNRMIDMVSTNVDHFGYKLLFEVFQPDPTIACFIWFKLECTYYLKMRTPR